MNTLVARPLALPEIGFGRVDVVKTRGKLLVAAADPKAVTIIVRRVDISAISQLDSFFAVAGRARPNKRDQQEQRD